jgi:PAS domain S-box-containing protein
LIIALGVPFCAVAFLLLKNLEDDRRQVVIEERIDEHVREVQLTIDLHLETLYAIRALFASSQVVEGAEFHAFVDPEQARRSGVQALEWAPRVSGPERAAVEAAAHADELSGFAIRELDADGNMVPAAPRQVYFPVHFVEPLAGNETALGYDLASEPVRRAALEKARDTGRAAATEPIRLVQETGEQAGFLVFLPIYRNDRPHGTMSERRENLHGLALGVFRVADMMESAVLGTAHQSLRISIFDGAPDPADRPLYSDPPLRDGAQVRTFDQEGRGTQPQWVRQVTIADRTWTVVYRPGPEFVVSQRGSQAWSVLLAGLLWTGMLAAYLLVSQRRTEQIRKLATDLSATNGRLRAETSERVRTEHAYSASEKRFSTVAEISPVGIFRTDAEGNCIYVNERWCEITGLSPGEAASAGWAAALDPEDRNRVAAAWSQAASGGVPFSAEYRFLRPDGVTTWVYGQSVAERRDDGVLVGHVGTVTDMRAAKEEAEAADQAKSVFLANTSHELRTPLNAIIGFSEIITKELFGPLGSPKYREYVKDIYESGVLLMDLINDILTFSKASAGKMTLTEEPVAIAAVIDSAIRLVHEEARTRGLALTTEVDDRLPLVGADERKLKQILLNLLSNAVKFTPPRGGVTVRAFCNQGGDLVVVVADTGVGISAENLPRMMIPFEQAAAQWHRSRGQGAGLGLPLVKSLVELHGGVFTLESEPGAGTTATVRLPADRVIEPAVRAVG